MCFSDETYQKMLQMVATSEYAMEKNLSVYEMNLREQQKYDQINKLIGLKLSLFRYNVFQIYLKKITFH